MFALLNSVNAAYCQQMLIEGSSTHKQTTGRGCRGLLSRLVTMNSINGRRIGGPSASSCGQDRHNWAAYKPHDIKSLIRIPEAYDSTPYLRSGPVADIGQLISRYHWVSLTYTELRRAGGVEEVESLPSLMPQYLGTRYLSRVPRRN